MRRTHCRIPLVLAGVFLCAAASSAFGQEPEVERLLARADELYRDGRYSLAAGSYLEAAGMSRRPINLSRAYFGSAICFFYQRDAPAAEKYVRKVAEVDPNKTISELFYPRAFIELFDKVMKESRAAADTPAEAMPKSRPKADPAAVSKVREPAEAPLPKDRAGPAAAQVRLDSSFVDRKPGGHLEIQVHYSKWTVDPVIALLESSLTKRLAEEVRDEVVKKLGSSYAGLVKAAFDPRFALDSDGSNYGLELRYYARGRAGTFSFGLGLERSRIRLALTGTLAQDFADGSKAEVEAEAFIETNPISPHVSFRWDIGPAEAVIKPYLSLGLGIAPLDGTFAYSYAGTYAVGTAAEKVEDAKTKTFAELAEDIDFDLPGYLPILHLGLGLRLELFGGLIVLGEAGLWDGLYLRGGLGFRF